MSALDSDIQTPNQTLPQADAPAAVSPYAPDPHALEALQRLRARVPHADPLARLPDVHPARLPRHIAIIMDGNGRWAQQRGFPRLFGHRNGVRMVREVLDECGILGVEALTLYSFSSENWRRPDDEVRGLMQLCIAYSEGESARLASENVRVRVIGRRDQLDPEVRHALDNLEQATAHCEGRSLCLAINYGARSEIADAARALAHDVASGKLRPDDIDEHALASRLYTAGLPDPDLLIRTGGEMRLSNYLLWQLSYAELCITDTLWPDFGVPDLHDALRWFASRQRRFGGVIDAKSDEATDEELLPETRRKTGGGGLEAHPTKTL